MVIKFRSIQALGRALMLPIAMLPVAGLLLRFGQTDLLNVPAIAAAGNAIFTNLPLLFAIGVAVGFAKDNNGAAGLAGAVGYLILLAMLKNLNKSIDTGVVGGILIGGIGGGLYNKYKDLKLPEFLAFFGGKRFIPIITGVAAVVLGLILGYIWPPIQSGLHVFSLWLANSGGVGLFLYGVFNRMLLITGLHHILNSLFWFQLGDFTTAQGAMVHGDIARFMAGDPSAGYFMAGFFPIMMFGLPALCLAMYTTAFRHNQKAVAGLLFSMALTSFLTGVTEPIEYTFVFLAPVLFGLHALLTGISMLVMYYLQVRLGFSFSAGAIDYVLFYKLAHNPLWMLALGGIMFVLYYILGRFFISKFNLATIGREDEDQAMERSLAEISAESLEMQFIGALGGAENLMEVDACTTRLRLVVKDATIINKSLLKSLGAKGVINPTPDTLQVVLGPHAEIVASGIREALTELTKSRMIPPSKLVTKLKITQPIVATDVSLDHRSIQVGAILAALGGKENIISVDLVALTRVKIQIKDAKLIDLLALQAHGILEIININHQIKQLYAGENAGEIASQIRQLLMFS